MLKRTIDIARRSFTSNSRVLNNMFSKFNTRGFATVNLDGLKNILKSEINHEETNYSPVDQADMKTFFKNTNFQFVDKEDSLNLELKKTHGNFEVIVNFQAKPPIPQEENAGGEEGEIGRAHV